MKRTYIILGIILLIGLFFRSYQIVERFEFAHDGDLYSWIVKDIIVDHHPRLIGQLTSAPGIFIGPMFYYMLVPFYLLFKMDPIGAVVPMIILGVATIFSYFFVLSKIFNTRVGLIGAFLHATLLSEIMFDRWVVPSTLSSIWAIWYLFTIIKISKGKYKFLPLLGILIGLIWHIHIALAPALLAGVVAFFLSKKIPKLKEIILFLLAVIFFSLPLILFETRHNFSQTKSFIKNFSENFTDGKLSEVRTVFLGSKNNTGTTNLDISSKFILEVIPDLPNAGDGIRVKIALKTPKNVKIFASPDCGNPVKYEIGDSALGFPWLTQGCSNGGHKIKIEAEEIKNSFWSRISDKLLAVIKAEKSNINNLIIFTSGAGVPLQYVISLLVLILPVLAWKLKLFTSQHIILIYSWIIGTILFFSLSSIVISEYYLASINMIFITTFSLLFSKLFDKGKLGKILVLIVFILVITKSWSYFNSDNNYQKGYRERKEVVNYILTDTKKNKFPCIGVSYLTSTGEDVGFRYFFYLSNIHLVHPSTDVPVYNIVIPEELSKEVTKKFGHIGIIPPTTIPSKEKIDKSCQTPNTNVTDSMFGYVD